MPYTPTTFVNDQAPALSAANLNKLTDELDDQALDSGASIPTLPTWVDDAEPALTDAAPLNLLEEATQTIATALGLSYTPTVWEAGWTPARNATRFNKLELAAVAARAAIEAVEPEPEPGHALATYRVSVPSGGLAHWLHFNSPTTQVVGTDGNNFRQRVVNWNTAGGKSPALYDSNVMYALTGFRLVTALPNRMGNWHTMSDDIPNGWTGPCNAAAVSGLAIDCNSRGLSAVILPQKHGCSNPSGIGPNQWEYTIFSPAAVEARRGDWIWLWMKVTFGRHDQLPAGALQVWVAGEDTAGPRISLGPVNTHWFDQHMVTYFQGAYWSGNTAPALTIEHAATRFGRTPQECYEDAPVFHDASTYSPPGSHTLIAPRQSNEAAIPSALAWS